jgi:DNA-binding MarR family transcriptional regulator
VVEVTNAADGNGAVETSSTLDDAVEALRSLTLAAQDFRRDFADHLGIGLTDTLAMSHLAHAGVLTAGELATNIGLAPSSVTTLINRLEHAGLVTREFDANNRRTVMVSLTDKGKRDMDEAQEHTRAAMRELGLDRIGGVVEVLDSLAAALTRHAADFAVGH